MSDEPPFIYSGRVKQSGLLSDDFLWIFIRRDLNDGKTLHIQSTADYPAKVELRLTEQQVHSLYQCLHNAQERWRDAK